VAIGAQQNFLGDPARMTQMQDMFSSNPAMEALVRYNSDGTLSPWLAESWDVDAANKTITYHLRKGVKFHDGTDFNAEAVKWNIEQLIAAKRQDVNGITEVKVVDEHTIQLTVDPWNSSMLESVGTVVVYASPTAHQANGADWAAIHPVGTGPFVFESWNRDEKIVYVKNPNYWQEGKPYLDKIEIYYMGDPMTASAALEMGEVDALISMSADTARRVEGFAEVIKLQSGIGAGADAIMFNTVRSDSPFNDVRVRQAAAYAIDKKAITEALSFGYSAPTVQWGLPGSWSYNPNLEGYPYNPEKAKELLAEAGYPNGFKTKIVFVSTPDNQQKFTAVQNYLSEVGIDAELDMVDNARFVQLRTEPDWGGGMIGVTFKGDADLAIPMSVIFANLYGKGSVFPAEGMELLNKILTAGDAETRQKYAHEVQKLVFQDEVIAIPFGVGTMPAAILGHVKDAGINRGSATQWTPEDAWLDK